MKKINFKGITESMSDGEMKNVKGGILPLEDARDPEFADDGINLACISACVGTCYKNGVKGDCEYALGCFCVTK